MLATSVGSEVLPGLAFGSSYEPSSNCRTLLGGGCVASALCCLQGELLTVLGKPEDLRLQENGDSLQREPVAEKLPRPCNYYQKKKVVLEKF